MTTRPIHLLEQVWAYGVEIDVRGDRLLLRPPSRLPLELLDEVRTHKPQVARLLQLLCEAEATALMAEARKRAEEARAFNDLAAGRTTS